MQTPEETRLVVVDVATVADTDSVFGPTTGFLTRDIKTRSILFDGHLIRFTSKIVVALLWAWVVKLALDAAVYTIVGKL